MHTSLVLLAVLGPGAAPTALETPTWHKSYSAASAEGKRAGKPLAVFIAKGANGWRNVCRDGKLSAEAAKGLGDYVCVYLDTDTTSGAEWARAFSLTTGLVISTKDGTDQAFRHSGQLSSTDLKTTLTRYASGTRVAETATLESTRISGSYTPSGTVAANYTPSTPNYTPNYAPAYSGGFGGSFGGGFGGGFGGRCAGGG